MRVRIDQVPASDVVDKLIGHRFQVSTKVERFERAGVPFSNEMVLLDDEDGALAFIRDATGSADVEIIFDGAYRASGWYPLSRLTVVLNGEGVVVRAFYG